jgi:hypothetical protein
MNFELDEHGFSWRAQTRFASWAGYLDRSGSYGGQGNSPASDGTVNIVFAPEGRDDSPLTADELELVRWLIENEAGVSEAVKTAVFREYPRLVAEYGYTADEGAVLMPAIAGPNDLGALIGLYAVNVHQIRNGKVPYLGFELGCTWDDEHGLGVLTHGTRVIEVGGADTAFLLWMAERDAQAA